MQWYEYGLLALIVVGASAVLLIQPKTWMRWVFCCIALILVWRHLDVEGAHWQVFPLYLGLGLLVVIQFAMLHEEHGAPVVKGSAWIALACCVASLGFSWALPMFDLPRPTGKYAVGVYSGSMHDFSRGPNGLEHPTRELFREVVVQFWYPAEPRTGLGLARYAQASELSQRSGYKAEIRTNAFLQAKPVTSEAFPVLLFNPRWAGARVQNTFLAEDLASHGYIVVALDHPYNGALVDTDHGLIASDRLDAISTDNLPDTQSGAQIVEANWAKELAIWVADSRFVLRQLDQMAHQPGNQPAVRPGQPGVILGFPWGTPRMDLTRVGAFGHSFGGAASLALLGAGTSADAHVRCAINLDGWTLGGLDHRTTQPVLLLYEQAAESPPPVAGMVVGVDARVSADDTAVVDASLAKYGGLRAYVAGTQHLDFTDQTLVSPLQRLTATGPIRGERIREITRGLVLAFFDQNLKGTGNLPSYPEVKIQQYLPAQ